MKAHVITIEQLPESVEAAQACVASAAKVGIEVERFPATTPADGPLKIFRQRGWPTAKFLDNKFSRPDPVMSCFLSHAALWRLCADGGEDFLILEHDARFNGEEVPKLSAELLLCNLGRPSFGIFKTPQPGFRPFSSNSQGYLKGAHGYLVSPAAARLMIKKAKTEAEPADLFLRTQRFPFMTEWYPWPIVCEDDFSTVQKEEGIRAKHRQVRML